jgi:hypothetical protein
MEIHIPEVLKKGNVSCIRSPSGLFLGRGVRVLPPACLVYIIHGEWPVLDISYVAPPFQEDEAASTSYEDKASPPIQEDEATAGELPLSDELAAQSTTREASSEEAPSADKSALSDESSAPAGDSALSDES